MAQLATVRFTSEDEGRTATIDWLQTWLHLSDRLPGPVREQLGALEQITEQAFRVYAAQQGFHRIRAPTGSQLFTDTAFPLHRNTLERLNDLYRAAGYHLAFHNGQWWWELKLTTHSPGEPGASRGQLTGNIVGPQVTSEEEGWWRELLRTQGIDPEQLMSSEEFRHLIRLAADLTQPVTIGIHTSFFRNSPVEAMVLMAILQAVAEALKGAPLQEGEHPPQMALRIVLLVDEAADAAEAHAIAEALAAAIPEASGDPTARLNLALFALKLPATPDAQRGEKLLHLVSSLEGPTDQRGLWGGRSSRRPPWRKGWVHSSAPVRAMQWRSSAMSPRSLKTTRRSSQGRGSSSRRLAGRLRLRQPSRARSDPLKDCGLSPQRSPFHLPCGCSSIYRSR